MIIHGKDIQIQNYNGSSIVAAARTCEVSIQADIIETATPTSGIFRTFIAGRKDWSVSVGYLVASEDGAGILLNVGDTVHIRILYTAADVWLHGYAIVQQCRITANIGSLAQGSFVFKGSGPLEFED